MNRLLALALCVTFGMSSIALAQPAKKDEKPAQPAPKGKAEEPKKETKKETKDDAKHAAGPMEDKPGEMHKLLASFEGEWQASAVSFEDGKPGAPEKGTMKGKLEFGGRFLHNDYNGRAHGAFFHGEGFTGYNNGAKRFEMCWVDSQSTGVMFMTGNFDAAKKVLTMTGEMTMPDGTKVPMRGVTTIVDKNTMKDEFFMTMGGKESKAMEITYTKGGEGESKSDKDAKKDAKDAKKEEHKGEKK